MSKLNRKKYSQEQIDVSKSIQEALDAWGFQHYVRHCGVSKLKYGAGYVIEDWSNEDMADFIVTDLLKLAKQTKDKE